MVATLAATVFVTPFVTLGLFVTLFVTGLGMFVTRGRQLCLEPTRAIFAPQSGHSDILGLYVEDLGHLTLYEIGRLSGR